MIGEWGGPRRKIALEEGGQSWERRAIAVEVLPAIGSERFGKRPRIASTESELQPRPSGFIAMSAGERLGGGALLDDRLDHRGGRLLSRARLSDIAYHAILADLPVAAIRMVIAVLASSRSCTFRPQSVGAGRIPHPAP